MATYFISDIHLNSSSTENSKLLLDFLQSKGPSADAIYILGDLFAIWFGDDITEPYSDELFAVLRNLTTKNVPIYFMHGNRDFLVGNKFTTVTGVKILPDPHIIEIDNQAILLTHGDQLCTADQAYQKFRSKVQHPFVKWLFLSLPKCLRKKIGLFVKSKANGKRNCAHTNVDRYDVVPSTATQWFDKFNVTTMIHGHTHNPAVHIDGVNTRIVLGDWNKHSAKILVWDQQGYVLRDLI